MSANIIVVSAYCLLLHTYIPPTPTEEGVPYIVSIFAENSAGNGTKCNITDFTNELSEFIASVVLVAVVSFSILEYENFRYSKVS